MFILHCSLGEERRRLELMRITKENQMILFRLSQCKNHYSVKSWNKDWLETLKLMDSIACLPRGRINQPKVICFSSPLWIIYQAPSVTFRFNVLNYWLIWIFYTAMCNLNLIMNVNIVIFPITGSRKICQKVQWFWCGTNEKRKENNKKDGAAIKKTPCPSTECAREIHWSVNVFTLSNNVPFDNNNKHNLNMYPSYYCFLLYSFSSTRPTRILIRRVDVEPSIRSEFPHDNVPRDTRCWKKPRIWFYPASKLARNVSVLCSLINCFVFLSEWHAFCRQTQNKSNRLKWISTDFASEYDSTLTR